MCFRLGGHWRLFTGIEKDKRRYKVWMANSLAAGKPVSTKGVHEQAPLDDLANLSAMTLSSSKEGHGPWRSGIGF
uniref:Uncharacterized protein n=1 Tax=Oryza meridionalis TaxID=40149 RepID=A0A0E0CYK7_9ORYZ